MKRVGRSNKNNAIHILKNISEVIAQLEAFYALVEMKIELSAQLEAFYALVVSSKMIIE